MDEPLLVLPPIELRVFMRGACMYCSTKCGLRSESGYSCRLGLNYSLDEAVGGDYVPMLKPGNRCPMKGGTQLSRTIVLTMTETATT